VIIAWFTGYLVRQRRRYTIRLQDEAASKLEVLKMVARGMSNAEIAEELTISPATAKTHVAHLLTKLDARDRIQLVIIACQSGLALA
jgi:DNA-binding NarL/FixJ family response regulator